MADINKTCFITNIGPHYRFPIFHLMGENLPCDFYLGDRWKTPIKTFEYEKLKGYRKTLKNIFFSRFYWQRGSVRLVFKPYTYYIMDGEPYCLSSWVILLLSKITGKKTIAWTHGWYGRESFPKKMIKKLFYGLHSRLLIYSEYAMNLMEKEGINPKKMYCIANSLDSDAEKELRNSLNDDSVYTDHFRNSHPVIIYCGRIQKRKKLEMLIDCIKELRQENCLVNIVFVGKDVEDVHIEEYAKRAGVEQQVWMYGPCYETKTLGQLFYHAHVCVSPGNVGLTAIHSLTFGCPVITHGNLPYQMPEFEAIKPGITGDFFQQDDVDDLKGKVKKWISLTPDKRDAARKAAFEEIDRKWNVHYQMDVIKKVISEV